MRPVPGLTLAMHLHLLLALAQQPHELLPPAPLAIAAWESPAVTVAAVVEGEVWKRVRESALWEELQRRPGFVMAQFAWLAIAAPVGSDPTRLASALAGGGVAASLIARDGADPGLLAVARMGDPDAGTECLLQLARLAKIPTAALAGTAWELPLGEAFLARDGDWLILATQADWIAATRARISAHASGTASAAALPAGAERLRERSRTGPSPGSLWLWLDGALLRADGYAALPQDLGLSLLGGDLHESLRVADWAGATLRLDGAGLAAEFVVPEPESLPETHAPFRPGVPAVSLPKIGGGMIRGVIVRDFGGWYNARDQYASAAAVAGSVEGDGNLRLLFGRDFGPEVLAWLEPHVRLLAARNPDAETRALELELPAAAIGLRLKPGAPEGLGHGFVNAFLAAVTFANFQSGAEDEKRLLLDLEQASDGGLLYVARRPTLAPGVSAPLAHNAEPALYVGASGEIWISSSIGLLRELLAAPVEVVASASSWAEMEIAALGPLIERAREAVVARRLLTNGGDFAAAERFADLVSAAVGLLDGVRLRFGPSDGYCSVRLEAFARAP